MDLFNEELFVEAVVLLNYIKEIENIVDCDKLFFTKTKVVTKTMVLRVLGRLKS